MGILRSLLTGDRKTQAAAERRPAPDTIAVGELKPFEIARHVTLHNGFPILDWSAVAKWLEADIPQDRQPAAWGECERVWLLRFRDALGPTFHLAEGATAMVLSSLERRLARTTLEYMERTLRRICAVLDGIARPPELGKELLVILDDRKQYYDYVSFYYPDSGEFAFSGGMHIGAGCSHFVIVKDDLHSIEPTIAHEMTHACVTHLRIPAWLNEGIAVNTEQRLAGAGRRLQTPEQMHEKHLSFWNAATVQEFWCGKSFLRSDEGNMLSYDLARILVDYFSRDWGRFAEFVREADGADAGQSSARRHLQMSLGSAVAALLEREAEQGWEPDPAKWEGEAERGAFAPTRAPNLRDSRCKPR